jgi:hypothetical protein
MPVNLPRKAARTATVAALLDSDHRTRLLGWAVSALRERRIAKAKSSELTRCAGEFTQLANVQLEYAKALGEKRAVYVGPLPSLAGVLRLLEHGLVDEALQESGRVRTELAPILAEARRRLHAARQ